MNSERHGRLYRCASALLATLSLAACYEGDVAPFRDQVVIGREHVTALAVSGDGSIVEVGVGLALTATGTTPAGSVDLSRDVTWTSSDPAVASVDDRGVVTGRANGTVTITATLGQFSAAAKVTASDAQLTTVTVSGTAAVDECGTGTYTASGHYDDGTDRDITALVAWSASDAAVARMSTLAGERNMLISRLTGSVGVTASRNGVDSAAFAVTVADNLTALAVTPDPAPQVREGEALTFIATGTWTSTSAVISRAATWSVANTDTGAPAIGTVSGGDSNPGRFSADNGGTGTLTAACGGLTDSVAVTVVFLDTLEIVNDQPIELQPNATLLLVLEGTYSDGSTRALNESATWSVVSGTTVTVSNSAGSRGRVTAGGTAGSSTVKAAVDGKEYTVTVSVL
ncbi:MAG: Ig-like domain-containing protein [Pseudomonadota bacterium]